jgi:hypothetical protein
VLVACLTGQITDRAGDYGDLMPMGSQITGHLMMASATGFVKSSKSLMDQ